MSKLTKKQRQQRESAQLEAAKIEAQMLADKSQLPTTVWYVPDWDYCARITDGDADYVRVEGGTPVVTILPTRYFIC